MVLFMTLQTYKKSEQDLKANFISHLKIQSIAKYEVSYYDIVIEK